MKPFCLRRPGMHSHAIAPALAGLVSLSLTTTFAETPPPHQLLPQDTIAFFTIPSVHQAHQKAETQPLWRLFQDPSVRPFKEHFMKQFEAEVLQPLQQQTGLTFQEIQSLAQGQITFAMVQEGSERAGSGANLILIDSAGRRAELTAVMDRIQKRLVDDGLPVKKADIRDIPFSVMQFSGADGQKLSLDGAAAPDPAPQAPADEVFVGQSESLLVIGDSRRAIEQVLIHQGGRSHSSLAEVPAFQRDFGPLFQKALAYGWIHAEPIIQQIRESASKVDPNQPPNPLMPAPAMIIDGLGFNGLKSIAFSVQDVDGGLFLELFAGTPASQRRGLFQILASPAKDSSPPAFVPSNALNFTRWRIDGKDSWMKLEDMFAKVSPFGFGMLQIAMSSVGKERDKSFDLRRDVLFNLGDDYISWKVPAEESSKAPNDPTAFLLKSPSPEKLAGSIKLLAGYIDPGTGIEVSEQDFLGHRLMSVSLPPMPSPLGGPPLQTSIFITPTKDYLLVANNRSVVDSYLRAATSSPGLIRDVRGIREAAAAIGGFETGLFGFQNDRELMRSIINSLRGSSGTIQQMLTMVPAGEGRNLSESFTEWIDVSLLPKFDKIEKYFNFSVYSGSADTRGLSLRFYAPPAADFLAD